ncbi:hypothetical protein [Natronobacterium texcoconense]|uniref:Uncharacterized protein n=1 Tax=Natronobacterium texcoconense TaxID=1095778 RepID=A0A1H1AE96_NATTX|nr:hypothetical protein [Natronobacterium texcoconense]SDQ37901.1 hypothetical protein SAMN04489842_0661 [Natronobacterium texcoconense]
MTDNQDHDHDLSADDTIDRLTPDEDLETRDPISSVVSLSNALPRGTISVAGGGLLLVSALRSLAKGQLRAIPKAIAGGGLVRYGLERRSRERDEGPSTFEPDTGDVAGGTDGKDVSDQAHAAGSRHDLGRTSETGPEGDVSSSAQLGDERDAESEGEIEFTDGEDEGETRSKPDATDTDDPRRNTDDDDVEIDVSDTAMADEPAEATGPDPEQAQPSQTDATEPEETPEEDASHMKVDPDEDADNEDEIAGADEDEDT